MNFYFFHLFRPDIITPNGLNVKRDLHEFQNLHAKSKVMRSFKFTIRFGDILIIFAETKQRFTSTVVNLIIFAETKQRFTSTVVNRACLFADISTGILILISTIPSTFLQLAGTHYIITCQVNIKINTSVNLQIN